MSLHSDKIAINNIKFKKYIFIYLIFYIYHLDIFPVQTTYNPKLSLTLEEKKKTFLKRFVVQVVLDFATPTNVIFKA